MLKRYKVNENDDLEINIPTIPVDILNKQKYSQPCSQAPPKLS